jgi:hypothetical protein
MFIIQNAISPLPTYIYIYLKHVDSLELNRSMCSAMSRSNFLPTPHLITFFVTHALILNPAELLVVSREKLKRYLIIEGS